MFLGRMLIALVMTIMACDAVAAESSYKGKTIKFFTFYPPSHDYDTWARLLARHIGRHIPGNPNAVVINIPGDNGLVGANYVYNVLKRDGVSMLQLSWNIIYADMKNHPYVNYDVREFIFMELGGNRPVPMHMWAMPPKTPDRTVTILQQAFEATLKDPLLLAEAEELGLKGLKGFEWKEKRVWQYWR